MIIQRIDAGTARKDRLVEIYKTEVYNHIDLHTYKFVDASGQSDARLRNAISSDHAEDADGMLIGRSVEFWEARLRRLMQGSLQDVRTVYADDRLELGAEKYIYSLSLPDTFNDNLLEPLAAYMHRFLAYGALYDWYMMLGIGTQAGNYRAQLQDMENDIAGMIRGGSVAKRPMQPFGPAYRF